ncbi:MAG: hypothetical protein WAN35_18860 [Terracidiphilus sp.]
MAVLVDTNILLRMLQPHTAQIRDQKSLLVEVRGSQVRKSGPGAPKYYGIDILGHGPSAHVISKGII